MTKITEYTSLGDIIKNQNVLSIPIISMRNYKTGKYNLMADGNISRLLSKFASTSAKHIDVLIPSLDMIENFPKLVEETKRICKVPIRYIPCDAYGENAAKTRDEKEKFLRFINSKLNLKAYDKILCEPNKLTYDMAILHPIPGAKEKMVYWCPLSATMGYNSPFIAMYTSIDIAIASRIPTIVWSKSQKEALGGNCIVEKEHYHPELFDYKTIYFPFRLSDPCYHLEEFVKVVEKLRDKYNFKVLYSDPNASDRVPKDDIFVKVPSDKEVYIQILKSKPIIPYLENANDVLHISQFEFDYYDCNVIMFKNEYVYNDNFIFINHISELEEALIKKLEEEI